jgi:hypothetical protein
MRTHRIAFDGAMLARGFWVYVWRVCHDGDVLLYVGRTGDSSSRFAASPFARLGQHLDVRPKAAANMLLRHLRKSGLDPFLCSYSLFAVGPLFPEQPDLLSHRKYRDVVAPIESSVARQLRADGYTVLGSHPPPKATDDALYQQVLGEVRAALETPAR